MSNTMTTTLNDGSVIPTLGLGVYLTEEGDEVENAVLWALEAGYRLIDTASIYRNEEGVGRALARSEVARDDIFVTTKVWNRDHGYESTLRALEASLDRLGLDYVDLYLIHWPVESLIGETWKALERLRSDGMTRSIGVSNFEPRHLETVLDSGSVVPAVNQIELHPHLQQRAVRASCAAHDIKVQAWSPLKQGAALSDPTIVSIAQQHEKTPAQVVLRWQVQSGILTIPKSVRWDRIIENGSVFDFELTPDDVAAIARLDRGDRVGPHPLEFGKRYEPTT